MKSKSIRSALLKIGTKPGSVIYTGEKKLDPVSITLISYDKDRYSRKEIQIDDLYTLNENQINWVNICGLHNVAVIERIGDIFKLDPLVLEDIVTVGSSPKYDRYDNYTYLVLSMLSLEDNKRFIKQEELSIILIGNVVLTFQEAQGDVFDIIRKRIVDNKGRIRSGLATYLFYSLIDSIVDQYFYILNAFEEKIEILETNIMHNPDNRQAEEIYNLRRELLSIRNSVWPLRDILIKLSAEDDFFSKEEIRYLNDVSDNIRQISDLLSSYRDLVMGLYEAYLSNISNKMNRIMTTLTIFSVVFIPLTFLAGVYGMNFKHFPELDYKYAYPGFWIICVVIVLGLFLFFKKKKWFV